MGEPTMIEIEVTEEHADMLVKRMENEVNRMENTLNSFRSNDITNTEAYQKLESEKEDLESGIECIQHQIDEQTEPDGLEGLFG